MLVSFYKRKISKKVYSRSPVISVGNLSVGGTGKTVFVRFLISLLDEKTVAIVLRGYGGLASHKQALLVRDGNKVFASAKDAGDEAYMLALYEKASVVVCSDRRKSIALLDRQDNLHDMIILDDAYQNFQVKKDLEVLLVDARYSLSKARLLPAGFLRERDFSRADAIVLTHASAISFFQLEEFKKFFSSQIPLFTGKNVVKGLFLYNKGLDSSSQLNGLRVILCAGIGNISGFVASVKALGLIIVHVIDFGDHHAYSSRDMTLIIKAVANYSADAVITTEKDWVKLISLVGNYKVACYVLRIGFEFLSTEQYNQFTAVLHKTLKVTKKRE